MRAASLRRSANARCALPGWVKEGVFPGAAVTSLPEDSSAIYCAHRGLECIGLHSIVPIAALVKEHSGAGLPTHVFGTFDRSTTR